MTVISCSQQADQKVYYIISKNEKVKNIDSTEPPPPPLIFYAYFNFIILEESGIYFHQKHPKYINCEDRNGINPPFLQLKPGDITKINIDTLSIFLETKYSGLKLPETIDSQNNANVTDKRNFVTTIASSKDTITNRAIKIIIDFMDKKRFSGYSIRNWTEEEKYVVIAKQTKGKYEPKKIKWKVEFDSLCK